MEESPRRRTPRHSAAPVGFSPTRITRLEEKQELQDLNKRLETYILKQRERDASQDTVGREIQAVRENAAQEIRRAQELYASQIASVREQRDREAEGRAEAEARVSELENSLKHAQTELDALRESDEERRTEQESVQRDLTDKVLENQRLRDEVNALRTQLGVERARLEDVKGELEEARERSKNAMTELGALRSRAEAAEQDLETFRNSMDSELQHYRDQVAELTASTAQVEDETRRLFTQQMQELLEQRQAKHDADKEQALAMLKAVYDDKIAAYREHLERAGHELEMLRNQKAKVEQGQATLRAKEEEFETVTVTLKKRVTELEEEMAQERARPNQILAQKNEIIRRLKASFKRKDEEFDELMDVKIALALEIKQYRQLLEEEEERLGYAHPAGGEGASSSSSAAASGKKRKRNDGSAAAGGESKYDDANDSLVISGMDTEGQYLTVRNSSTRNIPLKGWSLQSRGSTFLFPKQLTLKPGQSITVHTGPGAEEKESLPEAVAWKGRSPWDVAGDEAVLMSPEGREVARVEIIPTEPIVGDDPVGVDDKNKNCVVM